VITIAADAAAAPWALIIAVVGFVTSAIVGMYSAHTARKTAREQAQFADWRALTAALQVEVSRLHTRVAELENGDGRTQ
jgi:cell division protein FtsB